MNNTILWIYILLLIGSGLYGYFKANSPVSLITSSVAAALLILTTLPLLQPSTARALADIIMAALLVVFAIRLSKTKKFVPAGILLVVTVLALAFRHIHFS